MKDLIESFIRKSVKLQKIIHGLFFDWYYGVETTKSVESSTFDVSTQNRKLSWNYDACSIIRFNTVMKMLPEDISEYTFVDIGSGKGQILMLAAGMGFKRVIGIEFSNQLHTTAAKNIENFKRRFKKKLMIEPLCIDATEFSVPQEKCVVFLFNPFRRPVLERFMNNIEVKSRNRSEPLYLVYVHPTESHVIESRTYFKKIAERSGSTDAVVYQFSGI